MNGVLHTKSAYAYFGNLEWKNIQFLLKPVHQKRPIRCKYGQSFVYNRFVIGITAYAKSVNEIPKLERSRALACL